MSNEIRLNVSFVSNNEQTDSKSGIIDQKLSTRLFSQLAHNNQTDQKREWPQDKEVSQITEEPELIEPHIAKGGEGTIYLANWHGMKIIVKVPLNPNLVDNVSVQRELHVLQTVTHPYVLNLLGQVPSKGWLLLPYMEKKSLSSVIFPPSEESLTWTQKLNISWRMASGLECLHKNGILHCDIKSDNILLDENYDPKIADFGTAQIKNRPELQSSWGGSIEYWSPELRDWITWFPPNDLTMCFPEVEGKKKPSGVPPFSESSDVYALGTVFWEISEHYRAQSEVKFRMRRFKIAPTTPLIYRKWIERCRSKDPNERPAASAIFKALSKDETRDELLGDLDKRLAVTRIVQLEIPPALQLPVLDQPSKTLAKQALTEKQLELQEELEALEIDFISVKQKQVKLQDWQEACDSLLKNKVYWNAMSLLQRQNLQNTVCQYGYWVYTTPECEKSHWEGLESYILKSEHAKSWLLGLAETRIYSGLVDAESIAFLHMARENEEGERYHYAETVLVLSLLWQTLQTTLKTETDCRFYEVAKNWFRILKEAKEQFSASDDSLIKTSLPSLLQSGCECMGPLISRIHKRFVLLFNDDKSSSIQAAQQSRESDLVKWYENYQYFQKWDWIVELQKEVIQPIIEPYLIQAQNTSQEAFEQIVTEWVEPWLKRYAANNIELKLAIESDYKWIRKLAIAEGSKATDFDTVGFKKRITSFPKQESKIQFNSKAWITRLWQVLDLNRDKVYNSPAEYTNQVIHSLEKALHFCLPF